MNAVGDKRRASSEDSAYYFCQSKNSVDPKTDLGYATRFGNRIPAIIATVTAIVTEIIGVGHYKRADVGLFSEMSIIWSVHSEPICRRLWSDSAIAL